MLSSLSLSLCLVGLDLYFVLSLRVPRAHNPQFYTLDNQIYSAHNYNNYVCDMRMCALAATADAHGSTLFVENGCTSHQSII